MADYNLPNYPNSWTWYNSERRDSAGMVDDMTDSPYVYRFKATNHFILNLTGHTSSDNPLETTMFTYANGVRMVFSSWYTEHTDDYSINYQVKYYDKDGLIIPTAYSTQSFSADKSLYPTPSNIDLWYASSVTEYSPTGEVVSSPAGRVMYRVPTASPYDAPDITFNDVNRQNFSTYYGYMDAPNIFGDDLGDYIDGLELNGDGTPITPSKPEDDTSGPGGGDGDYNPFSDPIPFPDLPTGGDSISTGFIRVYTPSALQLRTLASKLWSRPEDLDSFYNTIAKIMNDPMEAIISLHSVPIGLTGTNATCMIGNYNSEITMPAVSTQFYTVNLGSIYIPEHWGSALDYSPYVTVDLFLPFVGVVSMMVDDIVGKTIQVKYNIDILSGATLACVMCAGSVLYTYNTNVILSHPISGSSWGRLYQSVLGMVGSVAGGAAMGGVGGAIGGAIGGALNVAMSKHSDVSRGGSIGGATGILGHFTPYLILHRPKQSLAAGFAHLKGYPSNITATLSSLSGYTEMESVHLTGIPCTDIERDEIMAQLYNGVIF